MDCKFFQSPPNIPQIYFSPPPTPTFTSPTTSTNKNNKLPSGEQQLKHCQPLYRVVTVSGIIAGIINSFPFMRSSFSYYRILRKKTENPLNNIIHVHNQLRKQYYPAASENAEDRHSKRRKKENKRKSKKKFW